MTKQTDARHRRPRLMADYVIVWRVVASVLDSLKSEYTQTQIL